MWYCTSIVTFSLFFICKLQTKAKARTSKRRLSRDWSLGSLQHALQCQITNAMEVLLLVNRIQAGGGVVHFQDGVLAALVNHCKQEHMRKNLFRKEEKEINEWKMNARKSRCCVNLNESSRYHIYSPQSMLSMSRPPHILLASSAHKRYCAVTSQSVTDASPTLPFL